METVNVRDLRNHGGEVLERVAAGETLQVVRSGRPVATLTPVARPGLTAAELIARRRHLQEVDPVRLRQDIDEIMDTSV